jgi:hypothetical protein
LNRLLAREMPYQSSPPSTIFSATFRAGDIKSHPLPSLFASVIVDSTPSQIVDIVDLVDEHVARFVSRDSTDVKGFNEVTVVIPHGPILDLLEAATPAQAQACHRAVYQ